MLRRNGISRIRKRLSVIYLFFTVRSNRYFALNNGKLTELGKNIVVIGYVIPRSVDNLHGHCVFARSDLGT